MTYFQEPDPMKCGCTSCAPSTPRAPLTGSQSLGALAIRADKLSDGVGASVGVLLKLDLGDDDVLLEHRAAARADGVSAAGVHVDVAAAAVLARAGRHAGASDRRVLYSCPGEEGRGVKTMELVVFGWFRLATLISLH